MNIFDKHKLAKAEAIIQDSKRRKGPSTVSNILVGATLVALVGLSLLALAVTADQDRHSSEEA